MTDYSDLRAKAEAATPGPWQQGDQGRWENCEIRVEDNSAVYWPARVYRDQSYPGLPFMHRICSTDYLPTCSENDARKHGLTFDTLRDEQERNAAFIAAANPQTILALLTEREADKARIAELEEECDRMRECIRHAYPIIDWRRPESGYWVETHASTIKSARDAAVIKNAEESAQ